MANVELYEASKRLQQGLNDLKRVGQMNDAWRKMAQSSSVQKQSRMAVSCQK